MTSPRPAVTLGASFDKPSTQWFSEVVNSAADPVTVAIYTICAA